MKKQAARRTGIVVFSMWMAVLVCAPVQAFDIIIDVAPNVLNIGSQSTVVTVHTDILYNDVAGSTVYLNDVAIDWWKADARGYFVAKFDSAEIKAIPGLKLGDYNTLTLSGYTTGGDAFAGSQQILVLDNVPSGKN